MRAYQLQGGFGLDHLHLLERPDAPCGPRQVAVEVLAVSLNYRDLLVVKGEYNPRMPLPRIPVSDGVGRVRAVGAEVTSVQPGDRVVGCFFPHWTDGPVSDSRVRGALGADSDGLLCTHAVLDEQGVVPVPSHLTDEEAATLPCAALTAWNALFEHGCVQAGQTVLVLGTGGVSIFALQFARLAGARVLVTSSQDSKLERARALGAHDGVNYVTTPRWDEAVRHLTGGEGVDHVVEVGGAGTLPRSMKAVRRGGHISLIGVLAGGNQAEVNPLPVAMRGLRLQGIIVGSRAMFTRMNQAITLHQLVPIVDRVFGFEEVREAFDHLGAGGHLGKVVVRVA